MDSSYKGAGRALILPHLEPTQRLKVLRDEGVSTLICGAISVDLLRYARQLGLTIVSGLAGEVHEVVQSYWQNTLDDPKFWLPGCRRLQRYRSGLRVGKKGLCDGEARLRGLGKRNSRRGQARAMGLGPGGFCRCPACGGKVPHEQGIPCIQVKCPRCGYIMERA